MRPDQFKKHRQAPKADDRARRQIAIEAARRMLGAIGPEAGDPSGRLREAGEAEYYAAKREAAAVLGRPVGPGDLPGDSEVREQALVLLRDAAPGQPEEPDDSPEPGPGEELGRLADHVDRFAIYRMRLAPLESVKQNPRYHPEGDALYHSLQVFEHARNARPYDEEFLLAAMLHDVGKGIDRGDHVGRGRRAGARSAARSPGRAGDEDAHAPRDTRPCERAGAAPATARCPTRSPRGTT